jgi:hypothetical protein
MILDFDEIWAARPPALLRVRVLGVVHEIPADAPIGLRSRVGRLRDERGDDGDLSWHDMEEIARVVFGDDVVDGWVAHRPPITEPQLVEVLGVVLAAFFPAAEVTS